MKLHFSIPLLFSVIALTRRVRRDDALLTVLVRQRLLSRTIDAASDVERPFATGTDPVFSSSAKWRRGQLIPWTTSSGRTLNGPFGRCNRRWRTNPERGCDKVRVPSRGSGGIFPEPVSTGCGAKSIDSRCDLSVSQIFHVDDLKGIKRREKVRT